MRITVHVYIYISIYMYTYRGSCDISHWWCYLPSISLLSQAASSTVIFFMRQDMRHRCAQGPRNQAGKTRARKVGASCATCKLLQLVGGCITKGHIGIHWGYWRYWRYWSTQGPTELDTFKIHDHFWEFLMLIRPKQKWYLQQIPRHRFTPKSTICRACLNIRCTKIPWYIIISPMICVGHLEVYPIHGQIHTSNGCWYVYACIYIIILYIYIFLPIQSRLYTNRAGQQFWWIFIIFPHFWPAKAIFMVIWGNQTA